MYTNQINHSQIIEMGGHYQSSRLSCASPGQSLKLLSLFSGIGAFEKALKNIGLSYDLVGYCEIDKYASKAYSLIHDVSESMNFGDIQQLNAKQLGDIDLITYGFPCQDISNAGKQKGFEDSNGNRTRSGLFFEALRIIEETKPKVAICENVKALISKKFKNEFSIVLDSLNKAGYNNYWQVLNAKDYGIPQNRQRVFVVSIRKDIDNGDFRFPESMVLNKTLTDVIESGNVDRDVALCVIARYGGIRASQGCMRRRYFGKSMHQVVFENTNHDEQMSFYKENPYGDFECDGFIRPLTPKECFRLMGFDDNDCDILSQNKISNTQLYKMAGNSIVIPVLEHIFKSLHSACYI